MSEQFPSRLAEKIVVRLPDGMRDRLAAAAKENKRSSNAEVVDRLERSFQREASQVITTVEVVLDSTGTPTSWDEIYEHLRAVRKAGQLAVAQMQVYVLTPKLIASGDREKEAEQLARQYKNLLKDARQKHGMA